LRSPLLVEARSEVDSDGGAVVSDLVSDGIGIHGIDVVSFEVHDDDLGISGGGARGNIPPHILSSDLTISGEEVVLEAGLIIMVGLPDHAFLLGVGASEVPVGVVVDPELGL